MKHFKRSFGTNIKRLICSLLCSYIGVTQAALPPDFQNERDLLDIVSYIKSDHEVLTSLLVIDLAELTVYYGESCRVKFARKVEKRESGWIDPAGYVELKVKECADDVAKSDDARIPEDKIRHGVIVSTDAGDTACYLEIQDDETGTVHEELASFDLCKDETLLNKPSEFIYQRTSVMAAKCGGDPECGDSEQVWLIAQVK